MLQFFNYTYYMKPACVLIIVIIVDVACSPPKKTSTKSDLPRVTRSDKLIGGTSFSDPIVIMVENERTGLDEEYKWLSINYPGYSLIRRTQVTRSSKHYDIVRIKTKQGI